MAMPLWVRCLYRSAQKNSEYVIENSQHFWSEANSPWWLFSAAHEQNRCHAPDHQKWCTVRCDEVHHPSWNISLPDAWCTGPCSSDIAGFHPALHRDNFQQSPREWYAVCYFFSPLFEMQSLALCDEGVCCKVVNTVHQKLDEIVHISCVYLQCRSADAFSLAVLNLLINL